MRKIREKGFTLAELLIVILIISILSATAVVFFMGRTDSAKDAAAEANLRAALFSTKLEYLQEGESFLQGPLATGINDQEKAENFVVGAIVKSSNLNATVTDTPQLGEIGVQMDPTGTSGMLYVQDSTGYSTSPLP